MDKLERDLLASPGEHREENCWCHHSAEAHKPDPNRDYRELWCEVCRQRTN